jgi:hypothetical protein
MQGFENYRLLVVGFSFFATERADQEDKIEGMRELCGKLGDGVKKAA